MKQIMNEQLNIKNVDEVVKLFGWVSKKRNLGGLLFIDLRDRSGIIQLVIRPEDECYKIADSLKNEFVIEVDGIIKERENKNSKIKTGEIEVNVSNINIVNTAVELPFNITDDITALEDTRLKYRYLDLRRPSLMNNFVLRHRLTMAIRNFLDKNNFLEIETPILGKSTPEGARDYLVPSRVNKGKFYALPQSPQLYKQLLMISGVEKYFQIAKCFRDEDLRADRQPEFTQVDVEMSFVDENDVMDLGEKLMQYIFKTVINYNIELPLMKMKYVDAISKYGTDKPDLRYGMEIQEITNIFKDTEIDFIKKEIEQNNIINCIVVSNASDKYTRKDLDKLTDLVKTYRANGLIYLKFNEEVTGSISKNITDKELKQLKDNLNIKDNDLVLMVVGKYNIVKTALGSLRCKIAKDLNLIDKNDYKMFWVVDFPSFEYSEEEQRFVASHHPFTSPKEEDIDKLLTDKANCYSKAYDIVINGYEAGGGSIRIHNKEIQQKMFTALGLTEEIAKEKFGYFMEAFQYGAPSHGGFALGLDRLVMLMAKTENIRDVIAFPKTASASCLMSEAPNIVSKEQLNELGIEIKKELK